MVIKKRELQPIEYLHSSPSVDTKTLKNSHAELEEEDEEEQKEVERAVASEIHIKTDICSYG